MANRKVASVALHRKTPPNFTNKAKKLKKALKNVFNYMKSDTYMFAPLISSQSYCNLSSSPAVSSGEISWEPMMKKEEKKMAENVKDYLKCDCYMYAPLVMSSALDSPTSTPAIGEDLRVEKGGVISSVYDQMETTRRDGGNLNISREDENDEDVYNPTSRLVARRNLVHKETLKHVVHQNCRSPSVSGKVLSQKKARKVVVE